MRGNQNGQVPGALPNFDGNVSGSIAQSQVVAPSEMGGKLFEGLSERMLSMAGEQAKVEGEAAGKIAGLDPNYAPQHEATIRGRAFESAATKTFLNTLLSDTRGRVTKAYDDWTALPISERDPAKLSKNFDDIQKDIEKNHIAPRAPELLGDFRNTYSSLALTFRRSADDDKTKHETDASKASNLDLLTKNRDAASRLIVANRPDADAQVRNLHEENRRQRQKMVDDGEITAVQAQKLNETEQQDLVARKVEATFTQIPADKREDFIKNFKDDYAKKGALTAKISVDTYDELLKSFATIQRQEAAQQKHVANTAVAEIEGLQKRIKDGFAPPADELAKMDATYGVSNNPEIAAAYGKLKDTRAMVQGFKTQRPEEIAMGIATMRASIPQNGASEAQVEKIKNGEAYLTKLRTDLATNPNVRAAQEGLVPALKPVNPTEDPKIFAAALQQRRVTAEQVGQIYKQPPKLLTPDERSYFKTIAAEGGTRMVQVAGTIVQALGPRAGQLFKEIEGDAPEFAHIGRLTAMNGDPEALRDLAERQRLKDGTPGGKMPKYKDGEAQRVLRDTYGDAFNAMPQFQIGASTAANGMFSVEALRRNFDPTSGDAKRAFEKKAQLAAGATFDGSEQYGGVAPFKNGWVSSQKVPIPPNVKASAFTQVVQSITDEDLKKLPSPPMGKDNKPMPARQIIGGNLVANSHGSYWVALGDPKSEDPQWVVSGDGKKFNLDLNALEPVLRQRVPKAYRGGQ